MISKHLSPLTNGFKLPEPVTGVCLCGLRYLMRPNTKRMCYCGKLIDLEEKEEVIEPKLLD